MRWKLFWGRWVRSICVASCKLQVAGRFAILTIVFLLTACSGATNPVLENEMNATPRPTESPTATPVPTPVFDESLYGTAVKDIPYCESEDPLQTLDLYFPESGGPWPLIFYVHGGSWMEGDKAEGEGWRGMNEQGYLVASVNYRMAAQGKFPIMIEDVKCAVRYLRAHSAQYNLDPKRISAVGASAGGHLVGLLGTTDESAGWDEGPYAEQSSAVQAVVSMAGIFDMTTKLPSGINGSIYYVFGKLAGEDAPPEMAAASPVHHIDGSEPPFLLLHGDNDGVVPYEQSVIMHEALLEAGVDSTLIIVEEGNHSLGGKNASPNQEERNAILNEFWETHLK